MPQPSEIDPAAAFAIFLPDAVRLNVWGEIVETFAPCEVEIVAAVPLIMTHQRYVDVYRENLLVENERSRLPQRWLGPPLFGLDVSIAMLLRARKPDGPFQATIGRVKGRARATNRSNGKLRELSPVTDRCLSFIHAPDDLAELARQSASFFPCLSVPALLAEPADRAIAFTDLAAVRNHVEVRDEPNPFDIVFRTIGRALAILAWDGRLAPSAPAREALEAVLAARQCIASRQDAATALAGMREQIAAIPAPEPRATGRILDGPIVIDDIASRRNALRDAARRLTEPARGVLDTEMHIIRPLLDNDVFLDPWERHRLAVCHLRMASPVSAQRL